MNDTMLTVVGNLVDDVKVRQAGSTQVANFRLASNSRRFDPATGSWVTKAGLFVDVECWNGLTATVFGTLKKGDPVIVYGELRLDEWEGEQGRRSTYRVKAQAVGPDLARMRVLITRGPRNSELAAAFTADEPTPVTDAGEPINRATGEIIGSTSGEPEESSTAAERYAIGDGYRDFTAEEVAELEQEPEPALT